MTFGDYDGDMPLLLDGTLERHADSFTPAVADDSLTLAAALRSRSLRARQP